MSPDLKKFCKWQMYLITNLGLAIIFLVIGGRHEFIETYTDAGACVATTFALISLINAVRVLDKAKPPVPTFSNCSGVTIKQADH